MWPLPSLVFALKAYKADVPTKQIALLPVVGPFRVVRSNAEQRGAADRVKKASVSNYCSLMGKEVEPDAESVGASPGLGAGRRGVDRVRRGRSSIE